MQIRPFIANPLNECLDPNWSAHLFIHASQLLYHLTRPYREQKGTQNWAEDRVENKGHRTIQIKRTNYRPTGTNISFIKIKTKKQKPHWPTRPKRIKSPKTGTVHHADPGKKNSPKHTYRLSLHATQDILQHVDRLDILANWSFSAPPCFPFSRLSSSPDRSWCNFDGEFIELLWHNGFCSSALSKVITIAKHRQQMSFDLRCRKFYWT